MKLELQIEIASRDINEKRGTSKSGSPYLSESSGDTWISEGPLSNDAAPYAKRMVDRECVFVDRYGNLAVGRLRLKPAV